MCSQPSDECTLWESVSKLVHSKVEVPKQLLLAESELWSCIAVNLSNNGRKKPEKYQGFNGKTNFYNHSTCISYIFHIISLHGKTWTQQIDVAPNVWLHSSGGRALHRYSGGHGVESGWSPDIFQASSFQLLKLEIYCDDHSSLSSTTALQCAFHIYFTNFGCWNEPCLDTRKYPLLVATTGEKTPPLIQTVTLNLGEEALLNCPSITKWKEMKSPGKL